MRKLLCLVLLSIMCLSCSNDGRQNRQTGNKIIFGEVYGLCTGDCRTLYLLTAQDIYEDSNNDTDYGNWENTTFEIQALPSNDFELANALLDIPNGLLDYQGEIGNQTWSDFDYYINLKVNGESKTWLFDEAKDNIDSDIKQYVENLILINNSLGN